MVADIARSKKGKRKLVIDDKTYYWSVAQGDDDYSPDLELTVLLEDEYFCSSTYPVYPAPPIITPFIVRQDILGQLHKTLTNLQDAEAPDGWHHTTDIQSNPIFGIGLDTDEDILLIAYQQEKARNAPDEFIVKLFDLIDGSEVSRDTAGRESIPFGTPYGDKFCKGRGKLTGKDIPFDCGAHYCGGHFRFPMKNARGDSLVSLHGSVYFQPTGKNYCDPGNNQGCVRLRRYGERHCWHELAGTFGVFGFSASRHYFIIAKGAMVSVWSDL